MKVRVNDNIRISIVVALLVKNSLETNKHIRRNFHCCEGLGVILSFGRMFGKVFHDKCKYILYIQLANNKVDFTVGRCPENQFVLNN